MPGSDSRLRSPAAAELLSDLEGAFQEKIDAAYFDTSKYLLDVLNRNYLLLEHIQAMRRYLLLGQGDFIRHLMDLLKSDLPPPSVLIKLSQRPAGTWGVTVSFLGRPELARPATTLYQHNLTGILETAVRATNAQFDNAEILKRLDVRLLEVLLRFRPEKSKDFFKILADKWRCFYVLASGVSR